MTGNDQRFVLDLARVFEAPAERVFGLLTEPGELAAGAHLPGMGHGQRRRVH
jgi:hypothetical protein